MITTDKRKAIFLLHQEGMAEREIARKLGVSRNTVRTIIRQGGQRPSRVRTDKKPLEEEVLRQLYHQCQGRIVRVQEKLAEEHDLAVGYSTLTQRLRQLGISTARSPRCQQVPEQSLLLMDRYHGVAKRLLQLRRAQPAGRREALARVKEDLQAPALEVYPDGSALVEIRSGKEKMLVREIRGQVRRGSGKWSRVRLWTTLLDWREYPAGELLELYGRRWEQEGFYRELKVDMRSATLLQSHTPETAAQEVAALILAYAMLVDERIKAAQLGQVGVLRISFAKVLDMVRGLWRFLICAEGVLTEQQVRVIVGRAMRQLTEELVPKRRPRACPRKLRQPVSSWPRLLRNTYEHGPVKFELQHVTR